MLILIGIYGLFFEFSNPGLVFPRVAGAICLLIAMYAFQLLPVSYAGLALILLGISFMVAEAFLPSFGTLGIGGVVAFVVGSLMLIDSDMPGYGIPWPLIASVALVSVLFLFLVVGMALKARHHPIVSGREELIGAEGEILEDIIDEGMIRVHGELWSARSAQHHFQRAEGTRGRNGGLGFNCNFGREITKRRNHVHHFRCSCHYPPRDTFNNISNIA